MTRSAFTPLFKFILHLINLGEVLNVNTEKIFCTENAQGHNKSSQESQ